MKKLNLFHSVLVLSLALTTATSLVACDDDDDPQPDTTTKTVGGAVPSVSAAVDLGLTSGTKWAPWNVGASSAGQAGAFFAWGETDAKETYDWKTYKHMKKGYSSWEKINKYTAPDDQTGADWYSSFIGDDKTTLEASDDAAAVNWGGDWTTPTPAQLKELFNMCGAKWQDAGDYATNSEAGILLTGPNGNKLFLPATSGSYWSSELSGSTYYAQCYCFDGYYSTPDTYLSRTYRYNGYAIRPVCPANKTQNAYNTPDRTVGGLVPTAAEAVDLGLPSGTLWAPFNLGASKPGEAGEKFAWAETTTKSSYDWDNYTYIQNGQSSSYYSYNYITKYQINDNNTSGLWYSGTNSFIGDNKTTLEAEDDAAVQNWGSSWQMPTRAQQQELIDECSAEWKNAGEIAEDALAGYLLTGPNGNTLFLPAAGYCLDSDVQNDGENGYYWSSDLFVGHSAYARYLDFPSGYWSTSGTGNRNNGFSVRPVVAASK